MTSLRLCVVVPYKQKKVSKSKIKRAKCAAVDAVLMGQKVPTEFSRRVRPLQDGLKSEEYRNMGLFFFPAVVEALEHDHSGQKLFAHLGYLMRLYYCTEGDSDRYQDLRRVVREDLLRLVELSFGRDVMSYNLHLVTHLEDVLAHGPLAASSAIPFEGSYADLRRSFTPGTPGIPGQILSGMLIRLSKGHSCEKPLRVTPKSKATQKTDDSLLYRYNESCDSYSFYRVQKIAENGDMVAREVMTAPAKFGFRINLDWSKVGVFEFLFLHPYDNITVCLRS